MAAIAGTAAVTTASNTTIDGNSRVLCNTTKGTFTVEVHESWAPLGAKRYLDLVGAGYYEGVSFYRVVPKYVVQFGMSGDPAMTKKIHEWGTIKDDPHQNITFEPGTISFAGSGPNTRGSQVFIAYRHSTFLGKAPWETPFGKVIEGMETVSSLYSGYGELRGFGGHAPDTTKMYLEGAAYVRKDYPLMDYIHSCRLLPRQSSSTTERKRSSIRTSREFTPLSKGQNHEVQEIYASERVVSQAPSSGELERHANQDSNPITAAAAPQQLLFSLSSPRQEGLGAHGVPLLSLFFLMGFVGAVFVSWRALRSSRVLGLKHKV